MSGVFITADASDTIRIDLDEKFGLAWNKKDFQFEKVYNVESMEDPFVEDYMFQFPSEIEVVSEGAGYPRVKIEGIGTKRHTAFTLRTEMAYTEESLEDVKIAPLKDGASALAVALHRTIDRLAARNISNGFTSAQGLDGVSVFNAAHPYSKATGTNPTTGSNLTTGVLNNDNLQAAMIAAMLQRDENGDPLVTMPNKIVFGPNLMYTVKQILGGDWEADTADRNMNVLKGALTPVMLHYFMEATNTNQWILLDDEVQRLKFYWRLKPVSSTGREEKTGNFLYRIRARIAYGWTDWRGSYGSTGTV